MAKKDWHLLEKELEGIPVLTTHEVPGYEITEYRGYVWGTTVRSKFIGHDILAAIRILIGGEVWPYTRMMNQAKEFVLQRLVKNGKALGADAIIGVRMGSSTVAMGAVEIFAYGTAVGLKKKRKK